MMQTYDHLLGMTSQARLNVTNQVKSVCGQHSSLQSLKRVQLPKPGGPLREQLSLDRASLVETHECSIAVLESALQVSAQTPEQVAQFVHLMREQQCLKETSLMDMYAQLHRDSPADGALIPGPVGLGFAPSVETAAPPSQHQLAGMAAANAVNISQGILDWALLKSAVRLAPQCQAPSIASSRPWPHQYKTWTQTEDAKLVAMVASQGTKDWHLMADELPGRTSKSCRLRYMNQLRPDINNTPPSLAEDAMILQLHALHGNKWTFVASHLAGRTDNQVKNRWHSYLKKLSPTEQDMLLATASGATEGSAQASQQPHTSIPSESSDRHEVQSGSPGSFRQASPSLPVSDSLHRTSSNEVRAPPTPPESRSPQRMQQSAALADAVLYPSLKAEQDSSLSSQVSVSMSGAFPLMCTDSTSHSSSASAAVAATAAFRQQAATSHASEPINRPYEFAPVVLSSLPSSWQMPSQIDRSCLSLGGSVPSCDIGKLPLSVQDWSVADSSQQAGWEATAQFQIQQQQIWDATSQALQNQQALQDSQLQQAQLQLAQQQQQQQQKMRLYHPTPKPTSTDNLFLERPCKRSRLQRPRQSSSYDATPAWPSRFKAGGTEPASSQLYSHLSSTVTSDPLGDAAREAELLCRSGSAPAALSSHPRAGHWSPSLADQLLQPTAQQQQLQLAQQLQLQQLQLAHQQQAQAQQRAQAVEDGAATMSLLIATGLQPAVATILVEASYTLPVGFMLSPEMQLLLERLLLPPGPRALLQPLTMSTPAMAQLLCNLQPYLNEGLSAASPTDLDTVQPPSLVSYPAAAEHSLYTAAPNAFAQMPIPDCYSFGLAGPLYHHPALGAGLPTAPTHPPPCHSPRAASPAHSNPSHLQQPAHAHVAFDLAALGSTSAAAHPWASSLPGLPAPGFAKSKLSSYSLLNYSLGIPSLNSSHCDLNSLFDDTFDPLSSLHGSLQSFDFADDAMMRTMNASCSFECLLAAAVDGGLHGKSNLRVL